MTGTDAGADDGRDAGAAAAAGDDTAGRDGRVDGTTDDARWLVVHGRRWRRTDPSLPDDLAAALRSHLGRGRSGVRVATRADDDAAVAAARRRVHLAKTGLGERGPRWWDEAEPDRLRRAQEALHDLDALDAEADGPEDADEAGGAVRPDVRPA